MNFLLYSLFLIILFTCTPLRAQYEKEIYQVDYSNSAGEKGVTTFIYNGRSLPYKAIWELKEGSRWSVNHHEFDLYGNMTGKSREFSDSITSRQSFTYTPEGLLLHETFSRSDGQRGEVDYIIIDNRCEKALCRGLNGWFYGEIHYHYSPAGVRDSASILAHGERAGKITYSYTSSGRLDKEEWVFTKGFDQTFRYTYMERDCIPCKSSNVFIRPSCSRVVRKELYDFNGEGGGPSYYEYDKNNRLQKKTFVRSDGLKTITEYYYRDKGLLEKSLRHYNDGQCGTFTYTYNNYGQITERQFLKSDGTTGQELYSYDEYGRIISGYYQNFDGWLTGMLEFSHDIYDRISSAVFHGENGLDARISFKYDENGELVRVHWLFSNGTTQTYLFKYS